MSGARLSRDKKWDTWRVGDSQSTRSCGTPFRPCSAVLYDAIWTSSRSLWFGGGVCKSEAIVAVDVG